MIEATTALTEVAPHLGILNRPAERTLRAMIARAIEQGVNLQREALDIGQESEGIVTPMRPPSNIPPDKAITKKVRRVRPTLPYGVARRSDPPQDDD
jgi:hypothetical protein